MSTLLSVSPELQFEGVVLVRAKLLLLVLAGGLVLSLTGCDSIPEAPEVELVLALAEIQHTVAALVAVSRL